MSSGPQYWRDEEVAQVHAAILKHFSTLSGYQLENLIRSIEFLRNEPMTRKGHGEVDFLLRIVTPPKS